jgi:hypothetical protein
MALILSMATQVCAGQTVIASKRKHDLYISLLSKSGKLVTAKDEYCVSFTRKGGEAAQAEDVFVEFAQQVGRIRESPGKFSLALGNLGRYCGQVDLGKQYYQPAFYHVEVHYTDSSRKRRTCHFFLTIK